MRFREYPNDAAIAVTFGAAAVAGIAGLVMALGGSSAGIALLVFAGLACAAALFSKRYGTGRELRLDANGAPGSAAADSLENYDAPLRAMQAEEERIARDV